MRTNVVLVCVLAALVTWERLLSRSERQAREASSRVRQLPVPERDVATFRIEDPARREVVVYARTKDFWRCLSRWGAVADENRIGILFEGLLGAQGIVQTRDRSRAAEYGFAPPVVFRFSLHGQHALRERGDLLLEFDLGYSLPNGFGSYVRLVGSDEVIALDYDLRSGLDWPEEEGLAPLLDRRIVPSFWSAGGRVERIEVRPAEAERYDLVRRGRDMSQDEMLAGRPPWEWILVVVGGRDERVSPPHLSNLYTMFLQSATYRLPVDPRPLTLYGLETPRARIILHRSDGEPLVCGGAERADAQRVRCRTRDRETPHPTSAGSRRWSDREPLGGLAPPIEPRLSKIGDVP